MFTDLGLNKQLLTAIEELGYEEPTEIQRRAIPPILSGNHVIGVAPTGTGKTAAFVLPILRKLNYAQAHDPRCLIFLPSRELAHQVYENCLEFGKYTDLRFVKLTGGNGIQAQRLALEDGADVIIATPGRFMDLYFEGAVRLRSVEILVLDEADKMMDMGFMPQLNQILEVIPTKRQNILFSATFHSSVEKLSEDFLEFPVKIEIDTNFKPAKNIEQRLYNVPNFGTKCQLLLKLLENEELNRVLVFVRTKETANNLFKFIQRKNVGEWKTIHANKGQNTRMLAYEEFKNGDLRGIVATDVASRGIDITKISHVINFDLPVMYSEYIHRVGRTGRANESGIAITFASPVEQYHIPKIEKMMDMVIPVFSLPADMVIPPTDPDEKKAFDRELDRMKRKDDPDYQGAFHDRKGGYKGKKVSSRMVKAYKFTSAKKKGNKRG
jgi:ATP-dependent RNA helicase RhlE